MEIRTLDAQERIALATMLDAWPLAEGWSAGDRFRKQVEADPEYCVRHGALSPVSVGLINDVQEVLKIWSFGRGLVYSVLEWQKEGKVQIPQDESIGFYGGGAYGYLVPYDRAISNGWIISC